MRGSLVQVRHAAPPTLLLSREIGASVPVDHSRCLNPSMLISTTAPAISEGASKPGMVLQVGVHAADQGGAAVGGPALPDLLADPSTFG